MITYKLGKHTYQVPTRWDDITPDDSIMFIRMCKAFELFERGKMDFPTFRLAIITACLDMDVFRLRKSNDIMAENLFRLSDYVKFPYVITENEDGSRTASVMVNLCRNLLPDIKKNPGYIFCITPEGMVDCNITAEQYVDTLDLMELYTSSRKDDVLDNLFRTLYPGCRSVSRDFKVAVYYNFRGILEWIKKLPDFSLIFSSGTRKKTGNNPLGLSASIFTLSKSGYGTLQEIKNLDLLSYLGALVQLNIDGILSLQSAGLKPGAIAEKMNLPLECILPYITTENQE